MKFNLLTAAMTELRYVLGSAGLHGLLSEVIETYQQDAENGYLEPERLRGFAQGLYAAGLLDVCGLDDVDVAICKSEGLS